MKSNIITVVGQSPQADAPPSQQILQAAQAGPPAGVAVGLVVEPGHNLIIQPDEDVAGWVDIISKSIGNAAGWMIQTGDELTKAKKALGHGRWLEMFKPGRLGFSERTAQMLMAIARHPSLRKAQNLSHLPPSTTALCELAHGDSQVVQQGIDEGEIHPEMTAKEAKAFVLKHKGAVAKARRAPVFDPAKRLARLTRVIEKEVFFWPKEQVNVLVAGLQQLAQQIRDGEVSQPVDMSPSSDS
jgi:hypothetical protein